MTKPMSLPAGRVKSRVPAAASRRAPAGRVLTCRPSAGDRRAGQPPPQPQAPPQQPPPDGPGAALPPAEARPPTDTVDSSFTVSSWPWGQVQGADACAIGRLTSKVSPHARQRYS
jgi:hypothetical protein